MPCVPPSVPSVVRISTHLVGDVAVGRQIPWSMSVSWTPWTSEQRPLATTSCSLQLLDQLCPNTCSGVEDTRQDHLGVLDGLQPPRRALASALPVSNSRSIRTLHRIAVAYQDQTSTARQEQQRTATMSLSLDEEYFKVLEPMLPALAKVPKVPAGDVPGRRAVLDTVFGGLFASYPDSADVSEDSYQVKSSDGFEVPIYHYVKEGTPTATKNPAIYYIHGGGFIALDVPLYRKKLKELVSRSGVQIFAPDFRSAPEAPYPIPIEDIWAGLRDLGQNAAKYGIDPARIAIMGDSGGGGLAAGLALKARDEALHPPLAKQILVYPMLDDRNTTPVAALEPMMTWSYDDNITGWHAYLGDKKDGPVPYQAAAARAPSVEGLPSTYIDVGGLDIFRDEDVEYARRLAAANIPTEFHLYPGVPHGFDLFAPNISTTATANANRLKAMTSF